ncbi:hypothetical protein [Thalassobacillus pellis]|uniref:hypothetical protein n=1 Tax=Thalassobacillus pellis TaxID=748008 RepID=UPI00195FC407|nr:hypothetical protein [Thalassobacillus pellis]MBM7553353.1 putative membrane protein [Thalassobacillus pellis]
MHWGYFHPIGFLLLAGLLIITIILLKQRYYENPHNSHTAINILEERLAKGEISIDEYKTLKETIKK